MSVQLAVAVQGTMPMLDSRWPSLQPVAMLGCLLALQLLHQALLACAEQVKAAAHDAGTLCR